MNYYNDFDLGACEWARELIKCGLVPDGDVDDRSIKEIKPRNLYGYTQCHFFSGILGWSAALRLAGWPETRSVWTGSCPCQPYSNAGKKRAMPTTVTSGQISFGSSASAVLSASLVNKWKELFGTVGLMEYRQTWRRKITPLGRVYWAHTARERRTSDKGYFGWPIPMAGSPGTEEYNPAGNTDSSRRTTALLSGWSTPRAMDQKGAGKSPATVRRCENRQATLSEQVTTLVGWGTPTVRDYKDGACQDAEIEIKGVLGRQVVKLVSPLGLIVDQSSVQTEKPEGFRLASAFSLWLQGFPDEWDACGERAMLFVSRQRRRSSKRSSK